MNNMIVDNVKFSNYNDQQKMIELETSFVEKVERIKKKLQMYENTIDFKNEN